MSNDNPLVAVTLWFKDGAALRQVFTTPIPQNKVMPLLGRMVAELGAELNIQIEPEESKKYGYLGYKINYCGRSRMSKRVGFRFKPLNQYELFRIQFSWLEEANV